ncbi:MAG: helix-turn-helix domain-containing protein [Clostridia bacterium]|nr:helix-turn-helix domain-containing protein [Clostridia bacterium]
MTTHDKKLGERIRELRLRLGITQKELAGDRITRNMLSLIESGNASPSVSTLLYIAERLGTSAGYFFTSTEADEGRYFKLSIIDDLKATFHEKKYRECIAICESVPRSARDDELSYLAAMSCLYTALESAESFDMVRAASDLAQAQSYAATSIYADENFTAALDFYGELFRTVCSDNVSERLCDYRMCGSFVPVTMIRYFAVLSAVRAGKTYGEPFPEHSYYARHIRAVTLLAEEKTQEASKLLRELSLDPGLPYYMKYRVLCGLEDSANVIGDFRLAYSSSRRKLELIDKCRI